MHRGFDDFGELVGNGGHRAAALRVRRMQWLVDHDAAESFVQQLAPATCGGVRATGHLVLDSWHPGAAGEHPGEAVGREDVGERRRRGLCCVPEERLGHAAVPTLSLAENAFLTAHHRKALRVGGFISARRSRDFASQIIQRFNVQCHGTHALASSLSGGNLQKFIVGREILQSPRVLVVSQPTWGVDAGAASAIHTAIQELAEQGAAVLIVSQDLDELMQATDRIGALCAGRLSAFFPTTDITVQQVGLLMGGEMLDGGHA